MMIFTNSLFGLGFIISGISMISVCFQRKHLLNCLLFLEMVMLSIFLMMMALASGCSSEGLVAFVILTFAACEASMGLSLLVILIRVHGNDYVLSLSTHKC